MGIYAVGKKALLWIKRLAGCRGRYLACFLLTYVFLPQMAWPAEPPHVTAPLSSQTPYRLQLSQFQHRAYLSRDGAPSSTAAIAQTPDGFLWFATQNGLYRFDGVHFDKSITRLLPTTNIFSLWAESNGDLWIGYTFGGFSVLHAGKLSNTPVSDLPGGSVIGFARTANNTRWIATTRGAAWQQGSRWEKAGPAQGYPGHQPQWFGELNGQIYLFDTDNAYVLDPQSNRFHPVDYAQARHDLIGLPPGVVWDKNSPYWASLRDPSGAIWAWHEERQGITRLRWNGTSSTPAAEEYFDKRDGLTGQFVLTYFMDRESNVWAATEGGVDRFTVSKFTPAHLVTKASNLAIAADASGGVWLGSLQDYGLYIKGDQDPVRADGFGLGADCSYVSPRGVAWMPGRSDLETYDGVQVGHIPPPPGTLYDARGGSVMQACQGIAEDAAGDMWISVAKVGVFRLSKQSWTLNGGLKTLPEGPAIRVLSDESGRIWLTYPGDRMAMIDHDRVKLYSITNGLNVGNVLALYVRGNHAWVAGDNGMAYLSPSGSFTSLVGKGDNTFRDTSGVVETKTGELWLNGPDGVYRISAGDIAAWLKQPNHLPNYELFTQADGINGVPLPIRPGPSMVESTDGRIWVATKQNLSWIDPAHIRRNAIAQDVTINTLSSGNSSWAATSVTPLPPTTRDIHIAYTAPAMSMPERVHFRYRLEGVDGDWRDDGGRREVFYTNMQPGSYHFEVVAINEDGIASRQAASLNFTIMPAFYQTTWFKVLVACIVVLALSLLYMLRLRLIEQRYRLLMEERLYERERIARDLHDTLLQGMQGMLLQVEMLSTSRDLSDAQRLRLIKIEEKMRGVLIEGRDAIAVLRHVEAGHADLMTKLEAVGKDAAIHSNTHFSLNVDGEARQLRPEVCEETIAIVRESVINAFKHARAEWVLVSVYYAPGAFIVDVTDNGIGITAQTLLERQNDGHWGVAGMRERASKLGGRLTIRSAEPQGTTVELALSGHAAYAPRSWLRNRRSRRWMFGYLKGRY